MSALAAVFGSADPRSIEALLAAQSHRGGEVRAEGACQRGAMGVSRFAWECARSSAGPAQVATDAHGRLAVADATLYYRTDLARALGRPEWTVATPAELALAAYERWGAAGLLRLEGDFAVLLWDPIEERLLLARDHVGRRPLFYRANADWVIAASGARAIAAHDQVAARINWTMVAAAVSGLLGGSDESGYAGVLPLPAGSVWEWRRGRGAFESARWKAPPFRVGGKPQFAEAVAETRRLLVDAVTERMAQTGPTAVWLSGGMDSPAVFGAGQRALETGRCEPTAALTPVSISYPEGDLAREDHWIQMIAERWNAPVTWVQAEGIPHFEHLVEWSRTRDDPYAHTFEGVNRRLSSVSVGTGARVCLDGYGGDQLFHVSIVALGDLFARGHWRALPALLKHAGITQRRAQAKALISPWLPPSLFERLQRMRGRAGQIGLHQDLAPWLAERWLRSEALQVLRTPEPRRGWFESPTKFEARWYFETPYFPRAVTWTTQLALEAGVEVRSPLLDRRLIEFVASRPLSERAAGAESKPLLREVMRGLIPDAVLAPRAKKTGIPRGHLHRALLRHLKMLREHLLGPGARLADAGVIDSARLGAAIEDYERSKGHIRGVQLFLSLGTELWLRRIDGSA